ncbi:uncharacterized protein LOC113516222 [Galleria mellonella]|uniref:Uncharacterized protein LOC113516222 n=1 Tax=Galleria mellonella TaxID=7137 RepID=A0A6J1WND1_GALME|nr:uncharacterized protein LOC113516222 [Galleria mellonella]
MCQNCQFRCPSETKELKCGFFEKLYTMFPSECAMRAHAECHNIDIVETPISYCIKAHSLETRRMHGESCPVFCPNHYRPVCGASKLRDYIYRTFNNRCYLDMLNCRGDEDFSGYVEVPLEFCQRHLMKNIFKEQVVISNLHDYQDYDH